MTAKFPQQMFDLAFASDAVERAVAAENLKAVASRATDPQVLLGLAFLARSGSPLRLHLAKLAVEAQPEYAPILAVLTVVLDRIDHDSINQLVQRDPDNALGHYLQAKLLYDSGQESAALERFRKAAACPELRLYESTTGAALFKALDALNLTGRDRLSALSWMASRTSNFGSAGLQFLKETLFELARQKPDRREEIADLLVTLGGHLYATNFHNRWFAQRALEASFLLKAEAPPALSPGRHGYAAAAYSLFSTACKWPGFEDQVNPQEVAQHLPGYIHRALTFADSPENGAKLWELRVSLPDSDKAAFEQARTAAVDKAGALIDLALTDPDGIVGAYLKGLPDRQGEGIWALQPTFVGRVMEQRPEVFRAAAAFSQATQALWKAGENDPQRANAARMMQIGWGLLHYASEHDKTFPDRLDALLEQRFVKPAVEAKSLLTGRSYVYVAAGEKQPAKYSDAAQFVLLYDDHVEQGWHQCFTARGTGLSLRAEELQEQLRKQASCCRPE